MGDWNELFSEGWIGTLSCLFGGHQADMSSFSTTRWDGNRVIDFPVINFGSVEVGKREEKIQITSYLISTSLLGLPISEALCRKGSSLWIASLDHYGSLL